MALRPREARMARRSTGQVMERRTKRGTVYALRFYVGGERHYETLGTAEESWNRRRAEDELAATMAAVRAGTWGPPIPRSAIPSRPSTSSRRSGWTAAAADSARGPARTTNGH